MKARQHVRLLEETTALAATQHSIELSKTYRLTGDHGGSERDFLPTYGYIAIYLWVHRDLHKELWLTYMLRC